MKLDHDCVRNILLCIEDSSFNERLSLASFIESERLADFSEETISYATKRLIEAGFIDGKDFPVPGRHDYLIHGLTWEGHHFLDNIRDDGVWKETKQVTSKVAGVSLPILYDVAASVVKKTLGLS